MNKTNPLYLIVVLFLFAGFVMYKSGAENNKAAEAAMIAARTAQAGEEIAVLKRHWKDGGEARRRLERIVATPSLKKVIDVKKTKKKYTLVMQKVSPATVDDLVNKVLNEFLKISAMKIERVSDTQASVTLEVEL